MTALDSDLIRRGDALGQIRDAYKKTYTAARRQGYKAAMENLAAVPARRQPEPDVPVIVISLAWAIPIGLSLPAIAFATTAAARAIPAGRQPSARIAASSWMSCMILKLNKHERRRSYG